MDERAAEQEQERMEEGIAQKSMLEAYFRFNANNPEIARNYTYETIGLHYYYDRHHDEWFRREQPRQNHVIRIGAVGARNIEAQVIYKNLLFCILIYLKALRMLLLEARGPVSFDALKEGHPTFQAAAAARGMVEDPQMWYRTIMDAFREMPTMRQRYTWLAILFANAGIQDIVNVFNKIVRDDQDHNLLPRNMDNASFEQQRQHILRRIDTLLRTMGSSCAQIGLDDPEGLEFTDRDLMNVIFNTITKLLFISGRIQSWRLSRTPSGNI